MAWQACRRRLRHRDDLPHAGTSARHDWLYGLAWLNEPDLELPARRAVTAAVAAFNHLEDSHLAEAAHLHAHAAAELAASLFGCLAEWDSENCMYWAVCPLSLMHLRLGSSVGFTARRQCSVCDQDLSSCPHLPGVAYEVVARRDADGACTICGVAECAAHLPGHVYATEAHSIVKQADNLAEISVVPRPRDPLARPDGVEIPAEKLRQAFGYLPRGEPVQCRRCDQPCQGFTSAEEAIGLA
jgi:hypothetical protein